MGTLQNSNSIQKLSPTGSGAILIFNQGKQMRKYRSSIIQVIMIY